MKLEVGMYVRTDNGIIGKIYEKIGDMFTYKDNNRNYITYDLSHSEIIKASYNIIDILEVGDVLYLLDKEYDEKYKAEVILDDNDAKSIVNYEQCDLLNLEYELIVEEHIKVLQILTKEQMEQMAYKVGE